MISFIPVNGGMKIWETVRLQNVKRIAESASALHMGSTKLS